MSNQILVRYYNGQRIAEYVVKVQKKRVMM